MIISGLEITNYKSHKNTKIEFDFITSFIGENDQGKTSGSIDPLRILLFNDGWNEDTIHWGEKKASFVLEGDFGKLQRARTKSSQTTNINGQEYSGTKGLTDQIAELTGVRKIVIDGEKQNINLLYAKTGYILFNCTGATARKRISSILGLVELENAIGNLKTQLDIKNKLIQSLSYDYELLISKKSIVTKKIETVLEIESKKEIITSFKKLQQFKQFVVPKQIDIDFNKIDALRLIILSKFISTSNLDNLNNYLNILTTINESEKQLGVLNSELFSLQEELSKIPTCEKCGNQI